MIPIKLQLKNFLSYGSDIQTIDFAPYHLICLSGKNGHGKSALLDAITWALWGQARKSLGTAKADQGLLRLGQTQMFVMLDFEFNGQTYRVRREFAKTYGKPHAALDFGLLNPETQEIISLTDKTIRQTQEKIESLLNLDMESFINSAFIRQGQSNEFSKKTPKERKNVLATILGLDRYETIRTLALHKIKESYAQKDALAALHATIVQELEKKEQLMVHSNQVHQKLTHIATQEDHLTTHKQKLDAEKAALFKDQNEYQMLLFKQKQRAEQEKEYQASLKELFALWRTLHKQLISLPDQPALEQRKKETVQEISQHQITLQKSLETQGKILTAKQELLTIEQQLQATFIKTISDQKIIVERATLEHHNLILKIKETEKQAAAFEKEAKEVKAEIIGLQKQLLESAEQQIHLDTNARSFERRKDYYQRFVAQGTMLKKNIDDLSHKKQLAHDDDNPSCPLCEQNLSATRKKFLKKKFETEEQFMHHRMGRLKRVTLSLKAILMDQHALLTQLKKSADQGKILTHTIDERTKLTGKLEQTNATIHQEIASLRSALTEHEKKVQQVNQELMRLQSQESKLFEHAEPHQRVAALLKTLETENASLLYNAPRHQQAQHQLTLIEQHLQNLSQLTQQAALQSERKKAISELCQTLKKEKRQKIKLAQESARYADLAQRTHQLANQEQELTQSHLTLRKEKEELLHEKGRIEHQQQTLEKMATEYEQQKKQVADLEQSIFDYQEIATATGKDGIQALLIEEAIPEIEQEANLLLAKLTQNQAQIFIESLRDLKSGGTKETLDIKISDAIGIRPYEMFSGGEAFRIDFALRIAISKLLARRAGTSLQTLIIDEGFGSQDEEGLGIIMDALYTIQEDFSKVIIVSHLPAMKDQFPVHFLVEKNPNGSCVRVMEQG